MEFHKYQGTGNDFVMIDNRNNSFPKADISLIAHLCNRRFGIGGDGLILLENDETTDFKMVYYNADGNQSSMCGNGGRCIVAFAKSLNIIQDHATFYAIDGIHHATINNAGIVALQMKDVDEVKITPEYIFLDTGSPHHIEFTEDLKNCNVKADGAKIRYSDLYKTTGSNVNFVKQISENSFAIRTYERGVEDETLSCGTGATAAAIAMNATGNTIANTIEILVEGGKLEVTFERKDDKFTQVYLKGPAVFVYKGTIQC